MRVTKFPPTTRLLLFLTLASAPLTTWNRLALSWIRSPAVVSRASDRSMASVAVRIRLLLVAFSSGRLACRSALSSRRNRWLGEISPILAHSLQQGAFMPKWAVGVHHDTIIDRDVGRPTGQVEHARA